ncbi:DUF5133 domain-containing protein [Streptomyces ficellus]|uniref:DUF5133 domain-containing protein n=1 Tax=Streptomyces ficellus TaxID=1977088 RepID=A0ABT7ZA36_9ACTN|nr:DUF5133 domain-containing protein [Streptomyces ficellus]MDN3296373.1 DUF5133 domain-containing protein [Streptomyces ficellus]
MLTAHPVFLSRLIKEYETLKALHGQAGTPEVQRRLEDVTYTLCVSTGTRDGESALVAARHQLLGTHPEDGPLLTT